jgi:hypothetical protein
MISNIKKHTKPISWITGGAIFIHIAGGFFDHNILHREDPHIHPETYQTQIFKPVTSINASSVSTPAIYSSIPV